MSNVIEDKEEYGIRTEPDREVSDEGFRRIEISILNEGGESVFGVIGNVNRETAHRFIENVGYAFIPVEKPVFPRAVASIAPLGKISCERIMYCTDYPEKCSECVRNKAMSYFKPKEEAET